VGVGHDEKLRDALLSGNIPVVNSTRDYDSLDGEKTRAIDETYSHSLETPEIAIEIPVNWTNIQGKDLALAQQWRAVTDDIFQTYIGSSEGKYAITDIIVLDKNDPVSRAFLIGKSIDEIGDIFLGKDIV
jgi:predicted GNAT superfamily acetyltransferase